MKNRRLFFALWPSTLVRESIVKTVFPLLRAMDGRTIQPKNLHITLHFIGPVGEDRKDCLHKAAQSIIAQPFKLSLDCFGHFSKAKIFWMTAQKLPAELSLLHHNLGEALSVCDFHSDIRPYSPHVSLLRKSEKSRTDLPDFSINWQVEDFVLVESSTDPDGVSYKVIEKYLLQEK
ncbi:MAG: RNA 2',3'-cyclic phosphodiesterase [Gammaproteobacteria bacterium]|nr:MAG: RNA 2',3'-cyclic phosphodiesterase [Gammaproteobacteria bacterium]